MRRRTILSLSIGSALAADSPAQAYWQSRDSNYNASVGGAIYQGPGDVVSGATAWFGLRAYNAAYATGSNNAINIRRASDNATQNIVILSNGNLDIVTANTFAGTDATASATTTGSSTTVALISASSTPHVGSTITGTGITQPCYVVSVGSFVGGAGSITVNAAQSLGVATSITMQYGLYVTEAYDQSGTGNHAIQATAGNQPQLLPLALKSGTLPGMYFGNASTALVAPLTAANQPWSFVAVANQSAGQVNPSEVMGTTGTFEPRIDLTGTGATMSVYAGAGPVSGGTAVVGTLHALLFTASGATSFGVVDGTSSGSINAGTDTLTQRGTSLNLGNGGSAGVLFGFGAEFAVYPIGFNSTQYGNMHTNQSAYWGTP